MHEHLSAAVFQTLKYRCDSHSSAIIGSLYLSSFDCFTALFDNSNFWTSDNYGVSYRNKFPHSRNVKKKLIPRYSNTIFPVPFQQIPIKVVQLSGTTAIRRDTRRRGCHKSSWQLCSNVKHSNLP